MVHYNQQLLGLEFWRDCAVQAVLLCTSPTAKGARHPSAAATVTATITQNKLHRSTAEKWHFLTTIGWVCVTETWIRAKTGINIVSAQCLENLAETLLPALWHWTRVRFRSQARGQYLWIMPWEDPAESFHDKHFGSPFLIAVLYELIRVAASQARLKGLSAAKPHLTFAVVPHACTISPERHGIAWQLLLSEAIIELWFIICEKGLTGSWLFCETSYIIRRSCTENTDLYATTMDGSTLQRYCYRLYVTRTCLCLHVGRIMFDVVNLSWKFYCPSVSS